MDFRTRPIRQPSHSEASRPASQSEASRHLRRLTKETSAEGGPHIPTQKKPLTKLVENLGIKQHINTVLGGIFILLIILFLIFQVIKSLDFSGLILSFGSSLETDQKGITNIMLVGVGGVKHDGPNLTDTILVASIDYKDKIIQMVSIPRDLFVNTKQTGKSKINSVYSAAISKYGQAEAMNILKETVSQITGLSIQYYVKINFEGFEKIVDSLGGLDVYVEKSIYDTEFPKGETTGYETFSIQKGLQHLDGETALKYARSRHTTSDYDRAKRQQELLFAIKEKALSLNVLTDPGKIQSTYNSVSESIDTNLSLAEIIELGKIGKNYGKENLFPIVLNDDKGSCGGLLYTPDRTYFADASVSLQVGNGYDYVHFFIDNVYSNIKPIIKQDKIQVLNGTKVPGLAYEGMNLLSRFCMNVVYYTNAQDRQMDQSTLYYNADEKGNKPEIIKLIQTLIPELIIQEGIPQEYLSNPKRADSNIVIELGKNYLTTRLPDPFKSLKIPEQPVAAPSTTQQTTAIK